MGSTPDILDDELDRVVLDVLRRRTAGEEVRDADVIAAHAHLMPRLADRLTSLKAARHAYLAARNAAPIGAPLEILDDETLNRPIELDADVPIATPAHDVRVAGYEILGPVGVGGQASVFKAIHGATAQTVALKVMLGGPVAASRHRRRFDREVAILGRLNHPNVARVFDRGATDDGSMFFAMEFIDGVPIDAYVDVLRDDPAQPQDGWRIAAITCLAKVARAVDEAHRLGIVHRDLKPSNLLVDRQGEPHVLDFGLARADRATISDGDDLRPPVSLTHTGQMVGSLPWTSPEQVGGRSRRADARTDVYALGVVAYHVLAGRFPYDVDGPLAETVRHIQRTVPSAPSGRGDPLDDVILKALAKRPEDRYPTAGALADDLERFLHQRPLSTAPARRRRYLRKRGVLIAVCTAIACFAALRFIPDRPPVNRPILRGPRAPLSLSAYTNGLGMRFVWVGTQNARTGSPPNETGRRVDETPHSVAMNATTWIGVTEVTQAQFRTVMGFDPSDPRFRGDDLPVNCVTWDEANEFCKRLTAREGRTYRLPTEGEWELACRATMGPGRFSDAPTLAPLGWYAGNAGGAPHAVATRAPNGWGLFDMHGNVAEWCATAYERTVPAAQPGADPTVDRRVVRGGAFDRPAGDCRAAARDAYPPDTRSAAIGFRVIMQAHPSGGPATAPATQLTDRSGRR